MEYKYQIELEGRETISPAAKRATAALKRFNKDLKTVRSSTRGVLEPTKKYDSTLKGITNRTSSYSQVVRNLGVSERQKEKIMGDTMERQNQMMKTCTLHGKMQARQSKKVRKSVETVAQGYKASATESGKWLTSLRKNSRVTNTITNNTKKSFNQISDSISSTSTAQQKFSSSLVKSSKSSSSYSKSTSVVSGRQKKLNSSLQKSSKITSNYNKHLKDSNSNQVKYTDSLRSSRTVTSSLSRATNKAASSYGKMTSTMKQGQKWNKAYTKAMVDYAQINKKIFSTTKARGDAERYTNALLKLTDKEYNKIAKSAKFYKLQTKAANDLAAHGVKSVNSQLKTQIALEAKRIEKIRRTGTEVSAQARAHNNAILSMNEGLKKYGTRWGWLTNKLSKGTQIIHRVGMGFLTLLGPIFLVGAALRTVKQTADWVFQPFIKFEDALYELRKTVNLTIKQMDIMGKEIQDLSTEVPIAADELANMAAVAGRLGIKGVDNIMNFTKTIAKMTTATTLSAEDAASSLAKIRTAFGLPINAIRNLASVLNTLENTTAATVEELVKGMENVGAAGKQIGVAADEAAAFAATLTEAGMSGERSGTRLRRMYTELARKSGEIMGFMEEDAQEWARTLEEDPTKAIMMYLKKLSEVESKTKRTRIAHEHFGKVGGFAVATLSENYDQLIENMKTANEQMKWGTSLQREFSIAIDKTSAKLQILENRSEAARREIGEGFTPTLINFKEIWIGLEEELADAITLLQKIRGEEEKTTGATGEYIKEINRLGTEIGTLPGYFEGYLSYLAVGTKSLIALRKASIDFQTLDFKGFFKNSAIAMNTVIKAREEMTKSSENFTKILSIEKKLQEGSNTTIKQSVDYLKNEGDIRDSTAEKIQNYESFLEREPQIRTNIINTVEDETKRKQELNRLDVLGANLKLNLVDAIIKEYDGEDTLTNKQFKNYQVLKKIYQDEIDLGGERLDFWDKETKVRKAQLALRDEESTTYKNVVRTIKQVNKERGNEIEIGKTGIQVYQQLLQTGHDLIYIDGEMRIVDKELGEQWSKGSDNLKERNRFYEKYLGTTKTGINLFENLIRAQIKLNDLEDELTQNTKELSKSTRDLYGNAEDLLGTYSSMYDTWDHVLDIEREAKGVTKDVIGTYDSQVDTIRSLVNKSVTLSEANKDVAASEKITTAAIMARNLAEKLHQKAMTATSDKEREAYKTAFDWLSSNLNLIRESTFGVGELQAQWDSTVGTVRKSLYGILGLPKEITKEGAKGITNIKDLFGTVKEEMKKLPQSISTSVSQSFKSLPEMMSEAVRKGISSLPESINQANNKVEKIKTKISTVKLPPGLRDFSSSNNWQDIYTQVTSIVDKIKITKPQDISMNLNEGNFLTQWDSVLKKMEEKKITLDIDVTGEGSRLLSALGSKGILNLETGGVTPPSKQFGGSIPETGLYKLHKGEEVLPKKETKNNNVNVTVNFPNMIINRELDVNKVRSKIVEVINSELSRKLRR